MSPLERRAFLKSIATASAAVAGSALLPPGLLAANDKPAAADRRLRWQRTPCGLCAVGCSLLVGIREGRAVAVQADPDSPVNAGLACVKGYHVAQALYAQDRLTGARVRRNGRLVGVPMTEALDVVADKLRETVERHGRDSVGLYGSVQWSITDAYVAAKFCKAALGTNNLDTDARLTSASAAAGLRSTFGLDGALGCFEDIDNAQVFVLWDCNLAETGSVLFSRMLERRRKDPAVRIIELATRTTRTSYAADRSFLYPPGTEAVIANAIAQEIVARRKVNRAFVDKHVTFRSGATDIGHGLEQATLLDDDAREATWQEYVRFLDSYTPERAQRACGIAAEDIRWLASLYADPARNVLSVWDARLNSHARGTWVNNLLYNIHLLVGKVAAPGNNAFCLAGGPSGCTSVAAAGALPDALPRGTVASETDRQRAARIWGVRVDAIPRTPGHHALSMFRAFEDGGIRFVWAQSTDPLASLPNLDRYRRAAARRDRFLVVSDVYPTATTEAADVVLPGALWFEREGVFGSAERRLQHFDRMVEPPGDAMSEAAQMIEVAKRLGHERLFPWDAPRRVEQIWEEYARFHDESATRLAPLVELRRRPGVLWPHTGAGETRWRYNARFDAAADRGRGDFDFYGHADGRARVWLRPYERPAEMPNTEYPFWLRTGLVLEHGERSSLTRRIPSLHRALPHAYVEINAEDARALGIVSGETVRVVSPRGALLAEARIDYRAQPPRGQLFVPSFDEKLAVHSLTPDASCPISGQPEYGGAARVERVATGRT